MSLTRLAMTRKWNSRSIKMEKASPIEVSTFSSMSRANHLPLRLSRFDTQIEQIDLDPQKLPFHYYGVASESIY